jgi:nucleotide-binding universal stress UspA family protein
VTAPVVVGYDGSVASEAALERGIAEAARSGGRLVVVTVAALPVEVQGPPSFGTPGDGYAPALPPVDPPEVERLLAAARSRVDDAGIPADYVWSAGEPAGAIVHEARSRGAAAVVVGHGHHGRIARWLGADIAAEVERDAGCPVIVVEP